VAFVPTMGALHEGHLSLARAARKAASFAIASIFVNPTQFGPNEDFARYPRNLEEDARKLAAVGIDAIFAPDAQEMYPNGDDTRVRVGHVAAPLEGAFRPGHFEGVATVVAKLFSIVGECTAFFGRKDYQQLLVVRRMVEDLFCPVRVVAHPIVRDADGLAMSSRNVYLSPEERARALSIVRGLDAAARSFAGGERRAEALSGEALRSIEPAVTSIDYVEVRDSETLAPVGGLVGTKAVLLVACRVGATRLIDNLVLGEDSPPLPFHSA
jgi:pantoate--beta-alanine ligase